MKKNILIGVTGGIAAYKILDLIKLLKSEGHEVFIILTKSATEMISLEDLEIIKNEIIKQISRTDSLKGKKIIITAGGTIEKIDEVRFIANRSSGKMGIALAEECYLRGGNVLLLCAKTSVRPRYLIKEKIF